MDLTNETPSRMNLRRGLSRLWRRGPVVLVCMIIAAGSAYAFARQQPKRYVAHAAVLFKADSLSPLLSGLGTVPTTQNQSALDTNVQLVLLGDIAAKTAARLGPQWTAAKVKGAIGASAISDTSVVSVTATAGNPGVAQRLASTYVTTFVTEQIQQTRAQIAAARKVLTNQLRSMTPGQRASSQGIAVESRAQTLAMLAKIGIGDVRVGSLASRPTSPTSPKIKQVVLLGAAFGLLIGLALAALLERFDVRIRHPEELEEIYELPLLAVVPERAEYRVLNSIGRSARPKRSSLYNEIFNLLRSYLRYSGGDREVQTLLVISPDPGEGKTTIAYNLAKAAAVPGSGVLLIEADLRRQSAIRPLLPAAHPALPDVLRGDVSMADAVQTIAVGERGAIDILVAGEPSDGYAGELIDSAAMVMLLEEAKSAYDFLVIDTPPLSLVADAVPLLTMVDGVLVVGRMRKSRRDAAAALHDRLCGLPAPVLGVVANAARASEASADRRRHKFGSGEPGRPVASLNRSASPNGTSTTAGLATRADDD